MPIIPFFVARTKAAAIELELSASHVGKDLLLTLVGGQAHIGAVSVALPRQSLENHEKLSASASIITVPGHKEDMLARDTALRVASRCAVVTTVVCGIHMENASEQDIACICDAAGDLIEQFCDSTEKKTEEK